MIDVDAEGEACRGRGPGLSTQAQPPDPIERREGRPMVPLTNHLVDAHGKLAQRRAPLGTRAARARDESRGVAEVVEPGGVDERTGVPQQRLGIGRLSARVEPLDPLSDVRLDLTPRFVRRDILVVGSLCRRRRSIGADAEAAGSSRRPIQAELRPHARLLLGTSRRACGGVRRRAK